MGFLTGVGSTLQIGEESSFNASVTPTALVDLTSESMKVTVEKGDSQSLLASKTAMSRDLLSINVDGSISFILRPEFAGVLLHSTLGGQDTVTQTTDACYEHSMALADANVNLPSLTLVLDKKACVKRYSGCTISSLTLECAANDYVKGSIDIKGVREEPGMLESLPVFSIASYRCTSATFTLGNTILDISKATLKIDNSLEEAPKTYASGLYRGQPQHGMRHVTISFDIPYSAEVEALKSTYLTSETNAIIRLSFSSSNPDYSIEVLLPNVAITEFDASIGGTGVLNASISGEALSVSSTEPITVVLTDKTPSGYGD